MMTNGPDKEHGLEVAQNMQAATSC